ncbi:quinone-dependent dihydroorotate dehydrogenase [Herpetosiphon llansteffanensis]|uniref:quinone-dependent dihydroorotate dehydrogenase n=1 Tax=Herpetosiphon llansteffanensis TaxID=2094568 RepID=UPI000D7BFE9B|nr:quinone-dependent dihydroorotate dehydrogenase [Herpetosiphon llansteffanensis]
MHIYQLAKALLFRLAPEKAHRITTAGLDLATYLPFSANLFRSFHHNDSILKTNLCGLTFNNPVGLAAGFDKDGTHIRGMRQLGFGFLELGTVTPKAQAGNEQPRLFRLIEDQALINRMGFNNAGIEALALRLAKQPRLIPLGINLGKNKNTPNEQAADDYRQGINLLGEYADYLVINISSPNTPGLRELSRREPLTKLLQVVQTARQQLRHQAPLFVKLSPDEDRAGLDAALGAALDAGVDGIIATNTTVSRAGLRSAKQNETGGLSGAPLKTKALETLKYIYQTTNGKIPLIGVGGIASGHDAYERILAGASAIQLYTSLIYAGPQLVSKINRELAALLRRDGFNSIQAAVGAAV